MVTNKPPAPSSVQLAHSGAAPSACKQAQLRSLTQAGGNGAHSGVGRQPVSGTAPGISVRQYWAPTAQAPSPQVKALPVDIRHNTKIDRTALAVWATQVLEGNGARGARRWRRRAGRGRRSGGARGGNHASGLRRTGSQR